MNIQNPIIRGFNPDPSILRVGDDYYIATSTFEWFPGVQIFHSKNLEDWKLVARPLNRPDLLDMRGVPDSCGVWAPALSYADGKFWLAYTNTKRFDGDFKDTPNYLTSCETIDGEWESPTYLNASGFDPSLFHDDDGRKYWLNMVWDHRSDRTYFKGIVMQEYDDATKSLTGPRKLIFPGSPTDYTEGPHLYKFNGEYYLVTAEGGTGYTHAVTVARSENIWGPYRLDPQRHVITAAGHPTKPLQRTGHGGVIQATDGRWYMSHLCSRPIPNTRRSPMGRETALQEVHFDEDGWIRLSRPEEALSEGEHPKISRDYKFDGELHEDLQWLRTPEPEEIFSLTARPGALRLIGRESPGSLFVQSLVARRQQAFCYDAGTVIEFEPDNFQQMAGLIAYYNQHKFHYLYISHDEENGRFLRIMSCPGDLQGLHAISPMGMAPISIPENAPIHLRVETRYDLMTFFWSLDGASWEQAGPPVDASILSDEAGKGEGGNFTGAFIGVACHDVTGFRRTADVTSLTYQEV